MPNSDFEILATPAQQTSDQEVVAFLRRFLPDFYFVNTPISQMRRHFALIGRLPQEEVLIDFHRPTGAQFTKLTLCAHDDAQPGLLSKVAGTLTALKINVHTAWIHTLTDPHQPQSERRIVLDTLILSESNLGRSRSLTPPTQTQVADVLWDIFSGRKSEMLLLAKALRQTRAPLYVHEITASRTEQGGILIKLRTANDRGVLFRITRALAAMGLDVAHAQVNTSENAVEDVFFVSRASGAPDEAEIALIVKQFRRLLENEAPVS